ncbi:MULTISPECIES: hypothetical protein [Corynebacterium]|uniref:hypothetical protein n=1 Tax=Corynebacterium TaxID=1716 RepID=UPI000A64EF28|nr:MULTISPECIES: hypothetical protein [Corynebacterium]
MLETIAGIPAHALLVHAAVAFLPTTASTVCARSSGEAMLPLLGLSEENPGEVGV